MDPDRAAKPGVELLGETLVDPRAAHVFPDRPRAGDDALPVDRRAIVEGYTCEFRGSVKILVGGAAAGRSGAGVNLGPRPLDSDRRGDSHGGPSPSRE